MPEVKPHTCGYDACMHHVTLEEWAVAHPDEAWEMHEELASASPNSRSAERIREALNATTRTDEGDPR